MDVAGRQPCIVAETLDPALPALHSFEVEQLEDDRKRVDQRGLGGTRYQFVRGHEAKLRQAARHAIGDRRAGHCTAARNYRNMPLIVFAGTGILPGASSGIGVSRPIVSPDVAFDLL